MSGALKTVGYRTCVRCPECIKKGEVHTLIKETGYYWCDHCGYKKSTKPNIPIKEYQSKTKGMRNRAVEMYEKGYTVREIKAETGINDWSLYDEVNKRGIPKRSNGRRRKNF